MCEWNLSVRVSLCLPPSRSAAGVTGGTSQRKNVSEETAESPRRKREKENMGRGGRARTTDAAVLRSVCRNVWLCDGVTFSSLSPDADPCRRLAAASDG
jgi:hypothetical protein